MKPIFADAFYYIALLNNRDSEHEHVIALAASLIAPLVTTDYVLIEIADALAASRWRKLLIEFFSLLRAAPEIEIISASREWMDRGLGLYAKRLDKQWSLTDCISFEIIGNVASRMP